MGEKKEKKQMMPKERQRGGGMNGLEHCNALYNDVQGKETEDGELRERNEKIVTSIAKLPYLDCMASG